MLENIVFFKENHISGSDQKELVVWAFVPGTTKQVRYVVDDRTLEVKHFQWSIGDEPSKGLHIELRQRGLISKRKVPLTFWQRISRPFDRTKTVRAFTRKVW